MRITQNNFYNRFVADQQDIKEQLDRLTRQISSGKTIKYGFEDPQIFTDTLRLDYEEHTLDQAVEVATDAQNFANNTDSIMFQFTDALSRFKTLLIQAANGSNSESNFYAIANELKSLKEHFVNLGNSSINGRYLFSGTKLDTKPLDAEGNYYGNGEELRAVVGAKVEVPYNISGEALFFGEDLNVNRTVTTNVPLLDARTSRTAEPRTRLEEITGSANGFDFTIRGRKSDGATFVDTVTLSAEATVEDLLKAVENAYGEGQVEADLVNGYIQVRDKKAGSSLLDFHIYGSENGGTGRLEFVKTDGASAQSYADGIPFEKVGDFDFRGNMPQYVLEDGGAASASTKLQETTRADLSVGVDLQMTVNGNSVTYTVDETTTYRQLLDAVKSEVESVTGNDARVELDRNGRITVSSEGLESFSLDDNANGALLLFQANDALTVDDPKHDFFASIDQAIEAVENGLLYPDGQNGPTARNPGIENALARVDHLLNHVGKEHTRIGAMSNSLNYAVERSETLKINVQTLRSEILDTDIGEASVKLNQLSLNFQALMASIAKVQNLSLVNYI